VGVIGLGRRWRQRYRHALQAMADRFQVVAVYDQLAVEAHAEARRLSCAASAGQTELVERPDVDVVLVLDPQWYGLWPLEAACRVGKPVFCCDLLAADDAHADRVAQLVQEAALPVMVAQTATCAPAQARVRQLLASGMGAPRLLLGSVLGSAGRQDLGRPQLPAFGPLLAWCAELVPGEPQRVLATGLEDAGLTNLLLDFGDGLAAHLTHVRGTRPGPRVWHLQVAAERGTVAVDAGQVRCWGPDGQCTFALAPRRRVARGLLQAFHEAVSEGRPPLPGLAEAHRLLRWRRLAGQSLAEGRWVRAGT
jgi:predicted dehydrogenase